MKKGIQKKVTLYLGTIDQIIDILENILKNQLFYHKKKGPHQKRFNKMIEKYLENNLQRFFNFLVNEYYSHGSKKMGLHSYKEGKKLYRNMIKHSLLEGLTPESINKFGYTELKKLIKEKKKLETKLNIKDINKYFKENKSFYYNNKEDIIKDLKDIRDDLYQTIYPVNFHEDPKKSEYYDVKSSPEELKNYTAYYISPDLEHTRKGTFYINTNNPSQISKHELYVLSLHEGIPGHHYEILFHLKENKPDYFKTSGYTSYSEGWALYSEHLGDYKDINNYYYKLEYDIHRTIRLIIDTSIHYFGWEYDKCFQFMKKYLSFSDDYIHRELLRYINLPGQALTYKIGEKVILYLRKLSFDQGISTKDFHKKVMEIGPCPLDVLIEQFNANL